MGNSDKNINPNLWEDEAAALVTIFYSDKTMFLLLKTKVNEFTDFAKLK